MEVFRGLIKNIEKELIEGNLKFKRKIMQDLESIEIRKDFPKYPVLFLTCMDPRIDIHKIFQLNLGDVFVLRNAGNIYTLDVLRSTLVTIFKYKIKYIIILGHLDCGMLKINLTELRQKLPSKFLSSISKNYTDLLPRLRDFFKPILDEIQNIKEQIKALEKIKDFYPEIEITGMLYDVKTGLVFEYEKIKDHRDVESFNKNYKGILITKKNQFIDLLGKIEEENIIIEDSNDLSQKEEPNEAELSTISERNNEHKDTPILENMVYKDDKIQTIMPKINVPKIKFHGVKIYIPKIVKEKRKILN